MSIPTLDELKEMEYDESSMESRRLNKLALKQVLCHIIPKMNDYIRNGVPIIGAYDKSPYTTFRTGKLYVKAHDNLQLVSKTLDTIFTEITGDIIKDYDITKDIDGFIVDFHW